MVSDIAVGALAGAAATALIQKLLAGPLSRQRRSRSGIGQTSHAFMALLRVVWSSALQTLKTFYSLESLLHLSCMFMCMVRKMYCRLRVAGVKALR